MKFNVSFERRFWQMETATITVEAKNAAEARRIGKENMPFIDEKLWEASDSGYDQYNVESVEAE